jgi:hypothetical protein
MLTAPLIPAGVHATVGRRSAGAGTLDRDAVILINDDAITTAVPHPPHQLAGASDMHRRTIRSTHGSQRCSSTNNE